MAMAAASALKSAPVGAAGAANPDELDDWAPLDPSTPAVPVGST
jgi:hypothetical protein